MKLLKGIAIFFLALGAIYLVGPKVETPVFYGFLTSALSQKRKITEKRG